MILGRAVTVRTGGSATRGETVSCQEERGAVHLQSIPKFQLWPRRPGEAGDEREYAARPASSVTAREADSTRDGTSVKIRGTDDLAVRQTTSYPSAHAFATVINDADWLTAQDRLPPWPGRPASGEATTARAEYAATGHGGHAGGHGDDGWTASVTMR